MESRTHLTLTLSRIKVMESRTHQDWRCGTPMDMHLTSIMTLALPLPRTLPLPVALPLIPALPLRVSLTVTSAYNLTLAPTFGARP